MTQRSNEELASELELLKSRLADLESNASQSKRRSRWGWVVAGIAVAMAGGSALAASGNCPNGLPFCFAPDTPALASQVNTNFEQMKEWMELKTGSLGDAGVVTSSLVVNGGVLGTNSVGNFHLDTKGNALYLNWFSGNGVTFGNGAQAQVGRLDGTGNWTITGGVNAAGGVSGGGKLCISTYDCAYESPFGCGGQAVCSAGKVMVGFRDGTSCGVTDAPYCCRLQLSTGCP